MSRTSAGVVWVGLALAASALAQEPDPPREPPKALLEEIAKVSVALQLELGPELKRRGYPAPKDSLLGDDPGVLERTLTKGQVEAGTARRAAGGYRWGVLYSAQHPTNSSQLLVTLMAARSPEAALAIKAAMLQSEEGVNRRIESEGGKVVRSETAEVKPPGATGGYACERTAVMAGKRATLCLDKVVVTTGPWLLEVVLAGPVEVKDVKLLKAVTSAALRGLGVDTTPPPAKD